MPQTNHRVQVLIDAREHALKLVLQRMFPQGHPQMDWTQNLPYGDINFLVDGRLVQIIERKEASDFRSSVCGARDIPDADQPTPQAGADFVHQKPLRFWTQRNAMILQRNLDPELSLSYVFEGSVFNLYYPPNVQWTAVKLHQLQKQLWYKYQIATHFVQDVTETALLIGEIYDTYAKHGAPADCIANVDAESTAAMGTRKKAPANAAAGEAPSLQLTPQQFLGRALVNVHGMTPDKAAVVVQHYQSMSGMIGVYNRCASDEQRRLLLADLKTSETAKRFGPKLSARVYASMYFGPQPAGTQLDAIASTAAPKAGAKREMRPVGESAPKRQRTKKKASVQDAIELDDQEEAAVQVLDGLAAALARDRRRNVLTD